MAFKNLVSRHLHLRQQLTEVIETDLNQLAEDLWALAPEPMFLFARRQQLGNLEPGNLTVVLASLIKSRLDPCSDLPRSVVVFRFTESFVIDLLDSTVEQMLAVLHELQTAWQDSLSLVVTPEPASDGYYVVTLALKEDMFC